MSWHAWWASSRPVSAFSEEIIKPASESSKFHDEHSCLFRISRSIIKWGTAELIIDAAAIGLHWRSKSAIFRTVLSASEPWLSYDFRPCDIKYINSKIYRIHLPTHLRKSFLRSAQKALVSGIESPKLACPISLFNSNNVLSSAICLFDGQLSPFSLDWSWQVLVMSPMSFPSLWFFVI